MERKTESPARRAGLSDRCISDGELPSTESGWPAQLIANRYGMDPARARLVAAFAFGGDNG